MTELEEQIAAAQCGLHKATRAVAAFVPSETHKQRADRLRDAAQVAREAAASLVVAADQLERLEALEVSA